MSTVHRIVCSSSMTTSSFAGVRLPLERQLGIYDLAQFTLGHFPTQLMATIASSKPCARVAAGLREAPKDENRS